MSPGTEFAMWINCWICKMKRYLFIYLWDTTIFWLVYFVSVLIFYFIFSKYLMQSICYILFILSIYCENIEYDCINKIHDINNFHFFPSKDNSQLNSKTSRYSKCPINMYTSWIFGLTDFYFISCSCISQHELNWLNYLSW